MKQSVYFIQAILTYTILLIFKILPASLASDAGGRLARAIGPRLGASRKAARNIENFLSSNDSNQIIKNMWENIGRVVAEYPHLETIVKESVTVEGIEHLQKAIDSGKGVILFGGHTANWEIPALCLLDQYGIKVDVTYRALNNHYIDRLLSRIRTRNGTLDAYSKSGTGGRQTLQALKKGHVIGILMDQKYNEGIAIDFMGKPAMTNPAFAQLAQKYGASLIPTRCERLKGCHFKVSLYPPLDLENKTIQDIILEAHSMLEAWIKERPAQWLWLHRRWDSERLKPKN